jgi:hypothetical protein
VELAARDKRLYTEFSTLVLKTLRERNIFCTVGKRFAQREEKLLLAEKSALSSQHLAD